ncbi:hypothetical protein MKQ68_06320 [Chitinophaga horti]|uniref:Uncharacterized protein n=1 Tax=Chitinophaga horti TaxID=2920382 RepID=A0ABY6J960_9BACT|nr:hypothetical protein [Chitinophaga horti]UYQ94704.1 hypothetical protein MKQ68_06320 [Chitinophaga horti]
MKKYILSFALLAAATGAFFVVKSQAAAPSAVGYYLFVGNMYDQTERIDPANYIYIDANPPYDPDPCAAGTQSLCGVYVQGNGTNPYIAPNSMLETRLENNQTWHGYIYYQSPQ